MLVVFIVIFVVASFSNNKHVSRVMVAEASSSFFDALSLPYLSWPPSSKHLIRSSLVSSTRRMLGASGGGVFSVLDYGAKCDGKGDDSDAFLSAFSDACSNAPSGKSVLSFLSLGSSKELPTVLIPKGKTCNLHRALEFSGPCGAGIIFQVDGDIHASTDPRSYLDASNPKVFGILEFREVHGLLIRGDGTIHGHGAASWLMRSRGELPEGTSLPMLLLVAKSRDVQVTDIILRDGPNMHLFLRSCENVRVASIATICPSDSINTNGIQLSDVQGAVVDRCLLSGGEDNVAIVNGSRNILIQNSLCLNGDGISIGSLGKESSVGCVQDVRVRNIRFKDTTMGVRIKTWEGGRGSVTNVTFENLEVENVDRPVVIDQFFCGPRVSSRTCEGGDDSVAINDVTFRNISGSTSGMFGMYLDCSSQVPCTNINIDNINLIPSASQHLHPSFFNVYGTLSNVASPDIKDGAAYLRAPGLPALIENINRMAEQCVDAEINISPSTSSSRDGPIDPLPSPSPREKSPSLDAVPSPSEDPSPSPPPKETPSPSPKSDPSPPPSKKDSSTSEKDSPKPPSSRDDPSPEPKSPKAKSPDPSDSPSSPSPSPSRPSAAPWLGFSDTPMGTMLSVMMYGAKADGSTDDTAAFESAFKAACESGKVSTVFVPAGGVFLLKGAFFFGPCKAAITFKIDGTIIAPQDPKGNNNPDGDQTYGVMNWREMDDLTVTGSGTVDGRGQKWWELMDSGRLGGLDRPQLLVFAQVNGLKVSGLTLKDPGFKFLFFYEVTNLEVRNIVTSSPEESPNTDSIHLSYVVNAIIEDCVLGGGDDNLAIINGTRNVRVHNIDCPSGHGMSVGSLGKDGRVSCVTDIHVSNVRMSKTRNGLRVKTWQGGRGCVRNIHFENVILEEVKKPIRIDQFYCNSEPSRSCGTDPDAVAISGVTFANITGSTFEEEGIHIDCSDTVPCTDVTLRDINIWSTTGETLVPMINSAVITATNVKSPAPPPNGWSIGSVTSSQQDAIDRMTGNCKL